jgi:prepilin-type N-terminal cleavage/methylation domain-containing protein
MKKRLADHTVSNSSESGMTLLEMIIAMVVASVITIGIGVQIDTTIRYAQLPIQYAQAQQLVQERFEDVLFVKRKQGYDAVIVSAFPDEIPIDGFPEYDRQVTITESAPNACTSNTTCKEVTVTISTNASYDSDRPTILVMTVPEQVSK